MNEKLMEAIKRVKKFNPELANKILQFSAEVDGVRDKANKYARLLERVEALVASARPYSLTEYTVGREEYEALRKEIEGR